MHKASSFHVGEFVSDPDCLIGKVTARNIADNTVTVVRDGDTGELEQFEYRPVELEPLVLISEFDELSPHYVASLFTFDAS